MYPRLPCSHKSGQRKRHILHYKGRNYGGAGAELGVAPERAYAIEDSYNGIRAAHAGHLLPIMVPDLLPANEEMQEKAEVVLPDLFEVIAYLKGEGAC